MLRKLFESYDFENGVPYQRLYSSLELQLAYKFSSVLGVESSASQGF